MTIFPIRDKWRLEDKGVFSLTFHTSEEAEEMRFHIEASRVALSAKTLRFFQGLPPEKQKVLRRAGLMPELVEAAHWTVRDMCVTSREELSYTEPSTQRLHIQAQKAMLDFFGDIDIRSITSSDCIKFQKHLLRIYAPSTVATRLSIFRQFFNIAVEHGAVQNNPVRKSRIKRVTKDREHFVSRFEFQRVLDAADSPKVKNLLLLSRYGGLRIPSETQGLRYRDIQGDRIIVTDVKRKTVREVPLFPELELGIGKPDEYICYQGHVRNAVIKAFRKAGVRPWPKLFMSMRSSRETELINRGDIPCEVIAKWIGHSVDIANRHYLQVTQSMIDLAVGAKHELQ